MASKRLLLFPQMPEYLRLLAGGSEFYGLARASSEVFLQQLQTATEPDPWTWGFAVVELESKAVIGMAGFKSAPRQDRSVEIAYGIAPAYEGRGYATEAALGLVEFARKSGRVSIVCAHTLPTNDPSKRVLEKCGFKRIGEMMDPQDGPVIRWELRL
jgi:ribosomal-protein-alanine N-acetyltransferase